MEGIPCKPVQYVALQHYSHVLTIPRLCLLQLTLADSIAPRYASLDKFCQHLPVDTEDCLEVFRLVDEILMTTSPSVNRKRTM